MYKLFSLLMTSMLVLTACDNKKVENEKPTVKIGMVIPLLGAVNEGPEVVKAATALALQDLANSSLNVEVIHEESSFDLRSASAIATKLADSNFVNAIISFSSTGANIVFPLAIKKNILHIALCSDIKMADGKNNFILWLTPDKASQKLLTLAKQNEVKKVIVFYTNQSGAKANADSIKTIFNREGISVLQNGFNSNEKDFRTTILKADNEKADLWVLILYTPSLENFVKTMKEMNIYTPFSGVEVFTYSDQKELFNGVKYVDSLVGNLELQKRKEKLSGSSNMLFVPYVYDAIMLIVKVNEKFYREHKRLPNGNEMAELLHEMKNFDGQVGNLFIKPNGELESDAVIKQIKNGKPVVVEN